MMNKDEFLNEHYQKLEENEDYFDGFNFAMKHYSDADAIHKERLTNELYSKSTELRQQSAEVDKIVSWFEKQHEAIEKAEAQAEKIKELRKENKAIGKLTKEISRLHHIEHKLKITCIKTKKEKQKYLLSRNYYKGIVKQHRTITKKWWYRLAVKLGGTNE